MRVWTFFIQGGKPFEMTLPNNPNLSHDGRTTVWKLCGSETLRKAAEELIAMNGGQVQVYTEQETLEQKALREGRHLQVMESADAFDYDQIDEGVRHTVRVLRHAGFAVSGADAAIHIEVVPARNLIPEALRLQEHLAGLGVEVSRGSIWATFDPCDGVGRLNLYNMTIPETPDAHL